MPELAVWATMTILPGKAAEAEAFLARSREVLDAEPGTTSFVAVRIDEHTYGVFDTFADQQALDDHIAGGSGKQAVGDAVGTIFASFPTITNCVVVERGVSTPPGA
jgi:quinol monooxygenase YgiN